MISRKRDWSFVIVFGIVIMLFLFLDFLITKDLKTIPSCMYGCDYYYENGITLDLRNNPSHTWQSSSHDWLGDTNTLPKASFYLRAFIAELFGINYFLSWKAVIYLSYLLIIVSLIGWWLFFRRIFKDEFLAILCSVASSSLNKVPFFKYSGMIVAFLGVYLYILLNFFEDYEKIINNKLKFGVLSLVLVFLIVFISNIHAMGLFITFGFLIIGWLVFDIKTLNPKKIVEKIRKKKLLRNKTLCLSTLGIVSFILILLLGWWYKVIFIYHGDKTATVYDVHVDLTKTTNLIKITASIVKNLFLNFKTITAVILTGSLDIVLLFWFFTNKRFKERFKAFSWFVISFGILVFSYLVTAPLLKLHLSPKHIQGFLQGPLKSLSTGILLYTLKAKIKVLKRGFVWKVLVVLVLIIIIANICESVIKRPYTDRFWKLGSKELPKSLKSLQDWIERNNINPSNMVVLTNNELSFMLHGVLGVKLLAGRQSHLIHFGDFQKYWLDSALILYSKNDSVREHLLKYYTEKARNAGKELYLYWDVSWVPLDYDYRKNTGLSIFDPFRFKYNETVIKILKDNNMSFFIKRNSVFEPSALTDPLVTHMDIIYVGIENYHNFTHPWSPGLDRFLELVWSYNENGVVTAKLFKINSE